MKDFIEEYKRLEKEADLYLAGMYKLQEEFDMELELGFIEYDYEVASLSVHNNQVCIQVYKYGYDWGGISDNLIVLPEDVQAKLLELRGYCQEVLRISELKQNELTQKYLAEKEANERAEYKRLQAKYSNK